MKPNRHEHAAARAENVEQLAQDLYLRHLSAVRAGDAAAIRDLSNGLLEQLANGDKLARLIRTALTLPCSVAGLDFLNLLADVVRQQAGKEAEEQIAEAERAAAADPEQCKPRSTAGAAALDQLRGGP